MGTKENSESETTSPLSSSQKDRVAQVQKFLVNVADPAIGPLAAQHGYDGAEHTLGWALWKAPAGVDRPLEHSISHAMQSVTTGASPEVARRFRTLDAFENRWFPRMRNALRRFVAADKAEAVEAAFFEDLAQQPEGPGVVSSVDRFLGRYADLKKSSVPGVAEAVASLTKKGLTDDAITGAANLVAEAKKASTAPLGPPPSAEAIAEATREQLAGFEKMNSWYIDWADTLRQELHAAPRLASGAQGSDDVAVAPRGRVPGAGHGRDGDVRRLSVRP
jgi:hypothetical protein